MAKKRAVIEDDEVEAAEPTAEQPSVDQIAQESGLSAFGVPQSVLQAFVTSLGQAIAAGISKSQRRKVTLGEYDPRSSFHPNKAKAEQMKRIYSQNGIRLSYHNTFDHEIQLLNRITRAGFYIDKKVVVVIQNEGHGDEEVVDIRFRCGTQDQRNDNNQYWTSFVQMLEKILVEQAVADQNDLDEAQDRQERALRREQRKAGVVATV